MDHPDPTGAALSPLFLQRQRRLRMALEQRRTRHLYRSPSTRAGPQGPQTILDGRPVLAFCSNDYLGLAAHPTVVEALKRGAERYGVGSGAAHLVCGHTPAHSALEVELAEFMGAERALLFSTGYMANLGVVTTLAGSGELVVEDRLNHASLVDGARLGDARLRRYRHRDLGHATRLLDGSAGSCALLATDGVFSMDGDTAPLEGLQRAAARHGAWMLVDDAHGIGVLGPGGRGTLEEAGLAPRSNLVVMGTLGKALGTAGAFVAGDGLLIETLIQEARTYIYTTAPPPALAEATRVSLRLLQREDWRRERLTDLIAYFRAQARACALPVLPSASAIQPLMVGDASMALRISEALLGQGIWVTAIRPPTVPPGQARLRVTLCATHTRQHLDRLLDALEQTWRRLPIPRPDAETVE